MSDIELARIALRQEPLLMRVLDISTAHIPKETADQLTTDETRKSGPLWEAVSYVAWSEYGWIFYLSDDQANGAEEAGHKELAALMRFAQEEGFAYLKLDCDGERLPAAFGMPEFEW